MLRPSQIQPPMVYVYERQAWEYKIVEKTGAEEAPLSEQELNALGAVGWELVGVVVQAGKARFYFKRIRQTVGRSASPPGLPGSAR